MPYAPATADDVRHMLDAIGVASIDELFQDVPEALRLDRDLDLPAGVSEPELVARAQQLASQTLDLTQVTSFLGCGSYDHFVPAVVRAITARSEYATAYTPYQPELSQGTLQTIFEFQSSIAALAGLPVANASLYDGATAVAEATYLSEQVTGRGRLVVLGTVAPQVRAVLDTYADAYGMTITVVDHHPEQGIVLVDDVAAVLDQDVAALVVQQPNSFGLLEDAPALVAAANAVGAVPVVSADPISLGVLAAPGSYGAGVVVGDGQPLGVAPSAGGPTFGFMAAQERFLRRMPGRIVGETVDAAGTRGYVLTLQTREQHIRREKATSNICTNQALCALAGLVHMSWLGPQGIRELGAIQFERAAAARARLLRVPGVTPGPGGADAPVFREFVVQLPVPAQQVVDAALEHGVLAGLPVGDAWPQLGDGALLVAATELRTNDDIELLGRVVEEVLA